MIRLRLAYGPFAVVLVCASACGLDAIATGPADVASLDEASVDGAVSASDEAGAEGSSPVDLDAGTGIDAADSVDAADAGPLLTLQSSTPAKQVDLGAEGTLGWIHWGRTKDDPSSTNEKASAIGAIASFVLTGTNDRRTFGDNITAFNWTNGAPTATENGTKNGIYAKSGQPKFTSTRKAGTAAMRLVVYAGVFKGKARFTVNLGTGAGAPAAVSADLDDNDHGYSRYQIDYRATDPTADLVITWELLTLYDPNNSNLTLAAATLMPRP